MIDEDATVIRRLEASGAVSWRSSRWESWPWGTLFGNDPHPWKPSRARAASPRFLVRHRRGACRFASERRLGSIVSPSTRCG